MSTSMRTAALAAALLALGACTQRPAASGRPMARVALGVGRPATAQLPGLTRLALAVTAADMAPVTADLPLDGSTTTLEVPAGKGRLFTLDAYGSAGRSHTGSTLVPELVAGAPARVTIHLAPVGAPPALTGLAVTPSDATIAVGATRAFTATGTWSDASTADVTSQVTWASSAPSVATITAGGLATGRSAGFTGITASLDGVTSGAASLAVAAGPTGPARWLVFHRFANPGQVASVAAAREDGGASVTLATVADGGDVRYAGFGAGRVLFTRAEPGGLASVYSVLPDGTGEVLVHQSVGADASVAGPLGNTVVVQDDLYLYLARVDGSAPSASLGMGSGVSQPFRSDGRSTPPDGQAEGRFWFLAHGTGRSGTWSIGPGEAAPTLVTSADTEIVAVEETTLGRRVFLANLDGQLFVTDPSGAPAVQLATDFDGSLIDNGPPAMGIVRPTPLPLALVGDRVVYPADDGLGGKYLAAVGLDGAGHQAVSQVGAALHLLGASATQAYAALQGSGTFEPVACDVPSAFPGCSRSFYTGERAGEAGGWGLIVNGGHLDAVPFSDGMSRSLATIFAADLWGDGSQATSPWAVAGGDLLVHAIDWGGDQDLVASLPDGSGRFDLGVSGWNEALVGLSGGRAVYAVDLGGQRDLASAVVDQRLTGTADRRTLSADPADDGVVAIDAGTVYFTRDAPGGGRDFHAVLDDGSRHVRLTDEPGVVKGFAGLVTLDGPAMAPRLDTLTVACGATGLEVGGQTSCTASGTMTDGSTADLSGLAWSALQPGVIAVDAAGAVTAVGQGEATLVASVNGEAWVWVAFSVAPAAPSLASIGVSPSPASVAPGATVQLIATGTYADGSTADLTAQVTWSSDTPAVALVAPGGLATGVAAGEASITAALGGVTSLPSLLTVAPVVTLLSIEAAPASASVVVGGSQAYLATGHRSDGSSVDLTPQVTWSSSDPAVASVSTDGLAMGRAPGVATFTAAFQGVTSAPVTLTVAAAPPPLLVGGAFKVVLAGGHAYVAGYWSDGAKDVPCVWIDGARIDLAGDGVHSARAAAVAVEGGVVYLGGSWSDGARLIPAVWLGATRKDLAGDGVNDASVNAISVLGGVVTAGGYWKDGAQGHPALWTLAPGQAAVRTDLPGDLLAGVRDDPMVLRVVQQGGHTYATGWVRDGFYSRATLWVDGVRTILPDLVWSYGNGLAVDAGTVYVAGDVYDGGKYLASLWVDGLRTDDPHDGVHDALYLAVAVSGGQVVLGGAVNDGTSYLPSTWVNGVRTTLPGTTTVRGDYPVQDVAVDGGTIHAVGHTSDAAGSHPAHWVGTARVELGAPALQGLAVTAPYASVAQGSTLRLTATATFAGGVTVDVTGFATWSSSAPGALAVDGGLATGVAAGGVTVTATLAGVASPALAITVTPPFTGNASSVVRYGGHTYVSGWWSDGAKHVPAYWVDGVRHDLAGDGLHDADASRIAVDGGGVHVSGSWTDGAGLTHAAVWSDGVRTDLPERVAGYRSYATDVTAVGGTVYLSGSTFDSYGGLPCTWSGSAAGGFVRTDLPGDLSVGSPPDATANAIAVDGGTVYAAGWVRDWYFATPSVFIGTARTSLPLPNGDLGGYWGFPTGIRVVGGTPYVSLVQSQRPGGYRAALYVGPPATAVRTQFEGDGLHDAMASGLDVAGGVAYLSGAWSDGALAHPCYWAGASRIELPGTGPLPSGGLPWPSGGIAVDAGHVYVSGALDNGAGGVKPVVWVDGVKTDLR